MKPTLNEKFIAYLVLLSGLSLSAVAVYYSVVGLTAIFAAAVVPIIIMGTTLEISKLVATIWLKQNWKTAPLTIKAYLFAAIVVLMIITSMGIFGFLSKAHSDQNLVSGDVISKIAVYDEKIKTEKENIEANRKALKQMDEGVDQVLGRSTTETGAEKAVAMRKSQQKERTRLQNEILQSQKSIAGLNDARAPIAAEVRKVEAEVGPIKYIAALIYGDSPDTNVLERAVRWVIILLVCVFDPLAIILLLASQISFQEFRERKGKTGVVMDKDGIIVGLKMPKKDEPIVEGDSPRGTTVVIDTKPPTVTEHKEEPKGTEFEPIDCNKCGTELVDAPNIGLHCPNPECGIIEHSELEDVPLPPTAQPVLGAESEYVHVNGQVYHRNAVPSGYVQNEEQKVSNKWTNTITSEEYLKTSKDKKA